MANLGGIKALRAVIEIGLTGALAILLGQTVWSVLDRPSASEREPAILGTSVSSDATLAPAEKYAILTASNPFTLKADLQATANIATLDAPETSLNLVLKGARAAGDQQGIAVIQLPDASQVRVQVGDDILDGVTLEYIFADRVTLKRDGAFENLYMRDIEGEPNVILRAGASGNDVEVARDVRTSQPKASVSRRGGVNRVAAKDFWRGVEFRALNEAGVRKGYKVSARGTSGALQAAGFEPNDIIRAVNSTPISKINAEDLQRLMSADQPVRFEVERGGQTVQVQTGLSRERQP